MGMGIPCKKQNKTRVRHPAWGVPGGDLGAGGRATTGNPCPTLFRKTGAHITLLPQRTQVVMGHYAYVQTRLEGSPLKVMIGSGPYQALCQVLL